MTHGDSLVVTGMVASFGGMAFLDDPHARVVPGAPRPSTPVAYPSDARESVEGALVTVDGLVVGESHVEAGRAISLTLDDHSLVVAFLYADSRVIARTAHEHIHPLGA